VKCKNGFEKRATKIPANLGTTAKDFTLTLKVLGKHPTTVHLKVVEAGKTTIPTTPTPVPTTPPTTVPTTVPPPAAPGGTSSNWSGYLLTGESGGYQAVNGEWTVPTLNCAAVPGGYTSDWVGVNGSTGISGLFQDGTTSYCADGLQGDYAWWTDEAEGYSEREVFAVAPGDLIDAEVWQETSGNYAGDWVYYVKDLTSGLVSSEVELYSGAGLSAEWIAEDPGDPITRGLFPLADFSLVTFTDLGLTVPSGSWTVPPYSDAWEMASGGSVEALPSLIQGTGAAAAFTITYESPGGIASSAASHAVERHAQSTFITPGRSS
jgi:hypothetical protein